MSINVTRQGGEIRVNTSTDGDQFAPFYNHLTDGRIVATWFGKGTQPGQQDNDGMFQQIFDANWNRIGGEVRMNVTTSGEVTYGYALALTDGRHAAFWSVDSSGTSEAFDMYFRVFQADGQSGDEIRINASLGQGGLSPNTYELANGNVLAIWSGAGTQTGQEDDSGIFFYLIGADGVPLQTETRLNDFVTDRSEQLASLTPLSDGGWVATYRARIGSTTSYDVWQQAFNDDGTKRGSEIKLTPAEGTVSARPFVKELANGKWATFWHESTSTAPSDIYYQVFNSDGSRLGDKELATASTEGLQNRANVVSLPNGGFLFVWQGKGTQQGQEDDSGYFYQRFDASGGKVDGETRLHDTASGSQVGLKAYDTYLTLQDGRQIKDKTVFLWLGNQTSPTDAPGFLSMQVLGADGNRIGSESRVNTTAGDVASNFQLTSLTTGGHFVVTWEGKGTQPGQEDNAGIFMQLFDGNGARIGSETRINTTTAGTQRLVESKALPNGGWLSIWQSDSAEGGFDIYQQVFDANGNRISGEMIVSTTTAGSQFATTLEVLPDGSWIVGWEGNGTQPGQEDFSGIFYQHFSFNNAPTSLSLSGATIQESAAAGTVAGTLSAVDPDPTTTFTYTLVDANGVATAHPLFEVVGNTVQVKAGAKLDFETAATHTLRVEVTDGSGGSYTQDVTVTVANVIETTPFRKTGTPGNDSLRGELGNDTLSGLAGNDILGGDIGKDRILTGTGKDIVVFDTKPSKANRDTIVDFDPKKDAIHLDNAIFTKLGKKGSAAAPAKMSKGFFALGEAQDRNDYVVYDKKTGVLSYDKDGSGAAKAVEIAVFSNKPALTAADFFVI